MPRNDQRAKWTRQTSAWPTAAQTVFPPQQLLNFRPGEEARSRGPGTDCSGPAAGKRREKTHKDKGELRDQSPTPRRARRPPTDSTPLPGADDELRVRRTHTQPALARQYVQGSARESRSDTGATRVPPPPRRHPRSSGSASVRGRRRRSQAAGPGPVSLSGGACGPPLPLLPRWPRAPLLRGESRWRRLWLCEEDGRGGGLGKATSKKS